MIRKVFVFAILAIAVICEAKKIKLPPAYPYIYSLELKFREDKINDYIVDSFFATSNAEGDKLLHCDIHLADLMKAIPIKKLSISDLKNALQELNLSCNDDDLNNAISSLDYTELKKMGFSIERVYKSLSKTYFKDRSAELLELLKVLGIAEEFSVAYTFGTEEDMFNAIRAGNFSYNNLAEINKFINAPVSLKDLFNILGLKKLDENTLSNFINNQLVPALIRCGLTEENLKNFLQSLGLTVSSYKDSKAFKKCYSDFTKDKSLAVAVSQNELVTNDDNIIIKYFNLEPYTSLVARAVEGNGISYPISAANINSDEDSNIIHIQVTGPISNFIDKSNGHGDSESENCKYITVFENGLSIQEATINVASDLLTMPKFFNTPFRKGSPLVCGQKLYGLASLEKWNSIIFDYVQGKQQEQIPSHPLPPLIENKPEVIEAIKEFFESIHASLNPCKYFHCGTKEEEDQSKEDNSKEEGVQSESNSKEEGGQSEGNSKEEEGQSEGNSKEEEGQREGNSKEEEGESEGNSKEEEGQSEGNSKEEEGQTEGNSKEEEDQSEANSKEGEGQSEANSKEEENQSEGNSKEEASPEVTSSEENTEHATAHEDSAEDETEANESASDEVGVVEGEGSSQEVVNKPIGESSVENTESGNVSENDSDDVLPTENSNVESSESNDESNPEDNDSSDVQEAENGDSSAPQEDVEPSEQSASAEGSEEKSPGNIDEEKTDESSASQDVQASDQLPSAKEESNEEGDPGNNVASGESSSAQVEFIEEDANTIAPTATEENREADASQEGENVNESSSIHEEDDVNEETIEKESV